MKCRRCGVKAFEVVRTKKPEPGRKYYKRWYYCRNIKCQTEIFFRPEDAVNPWKCEVEHVYETENTYEHPPWETYEEYKAKN